uniref:Uncharacterized protein n=1 Tax=Anguilla anguilla TaxID=7936 RepID=A0A0E9X672_ANGAN
MVVMWIISHKCIPYAFQFITKFACQHCCVICQLHLKSKMSHMAISVHNMCESLSKPKTNSLVTDIYFCVAF